MGNSTPLPTNEAQARELAPLRAEPERLRAAWAEATFAHSATTFG